ncbi:MAG TPA: hypothetical protein G4O03_05265 [Dehalococcoidia bacterium]|nr:hypothetical protein [Dehalococcoidia bacterium]
MSRRLRLALLAAFLAVSVISPLLAYAVTQVNGDFSLELKVNGQDISELETIVIDPERELTIDLRIFDVAREITLKRVSAVVTFAGQTVVTLGEELDFRIKAGREYRERITVSPKEVLKLGNLTLVTGIYHARVKLEYVVAGRSKIWSTSKNIRIPGNPLSTPVGAAAAAVSLATAATGLALARSLVAPSLAAGTTMPAGTSVTCRPHLYDLALDRLEPTATGRVMGNIAKAARGLIVKERCPICDTRLKHGHCYTCKRSAKEVRNEYAEKVRALAIQGAELLASGEVATLDELCSRLGISARLGTDVIATLRNAKLVKVRGLARKFMGKAVMAGIGSGLSAVLWITVGGFAALSTSALIAILVASVVIPLVLAKGLQMRARRALKKMS